VRLGLLASQRGTNLQAIVDACKSGRLAAVPAVVISNNSGSGAAQRAEREGIPFHHLSGKTHPSAEALDTAIDETLEGYGVELVILVGYMKKLGPKTLSRFAGRVINTHPALLPKFGGQGMYGARVHEAVLAAGEKETGISVHVVDQDYDTGPVIAQCRVRVEPGDTPDSLAERVVAREHEFLVETIAAIVDGQIPLPLES
jgi:phosphoribosylglycinamide formyltransferase-1